MKNEQPIIIQKATRSDSKAIHDLIHQAHINPMDLKWDRFLVAVSPDGRFLGCGQVKVHHGDVRELASIAVIPEARHQGIAGKIIRQLIEPTTDELYLTCRARLESFYQPFGFERATDPNFLPRYFARIVKLSKNLLEMKIIHEPICVMRKEHK